MALGFGALGSRGLSGLPLADPTAPTAPALDSWIGSAPARPVRRRHALAVYVAALAFVPVIASAASEDAAPGTQGGEPPSTRQTVQYQALTGPVAIPAAVGETITVDKWHGQSVMPVRRVTSPASAVVAPIHVPDVTAPVEPLAWAPCAPDRLPRRWPNPSPSLAAPLAVPDVTAPVAPLSWAPVAPPMLARRPVAPRPETVGPLVDVAAPTVDQPWVAPLMPGRRPTRPVSPSAVAPLYVPDVTAAVPDLSWRVEPAPLARLARRPPRVTLTAPVAPETPSAAPGQPDAPPAIVARRTPWRPLGGVTAPVLVPDVTQPVPPLSWLARTREPAPRRTARLGAAGVLPPYQPAATVSLDWLYRAPDPRRRPAPRPLSGVVGPVVFASAAPVGWAATDAQPIRLLRRRPSTVVAAPVLVPAAGETVTLDKWYAPPSRPVRAVVRPQAPDRSLAWQVASVEPVPTGNLWEDISQTPGDTPHGTPVAGSGASPFDTPISMTGASPFETPATDTGTSPFGAPPAASGRSPWDTP